MRTFLPQFVSVELETWENRLDYEGFFHNLRTQREAFLKGDNARSRSFSFQLFKKANWYFSFLREASQRELQSSVKMINETSSKQGLPCVSKISFEGGFSSSLQKQDLVGGQEVLVVFLGETPKDFKGSSDGGLLSKMMGAMQFEPGEAVRIFLDKELSQEETWTLVSSDLLRLKPKAVVALGAYATNLSLGRKERLSLVHGKEFPLSLPLGEAETVVIPCFPVFHPDILQINPNMKRSAWIDLQKVADYLGKKV